MKIICFIVILTTFLSCNSIKVKEFELDTTQNLIGKIKQIDMTSFYYPQFEADTVVWKTNSTVFFDTKNRITKQIDYYPEFIDEIDFTYKNNLLQNIISNNGKRTRKIIYKYDNKNNVIEYSQLEIDTLYFKKSSIYDNKNNPIESTYSHPEYKRNNSSEKFTYDYKNSFVTIQSFDEENKPKNHYLKNYFNKKGFIIKTEFINNDSNRGYLSTSIIEYDKHGNLLRRISLDNNGKPREIIEYKNTYDEKGNIIVREKYNKQKLLEKTIYKLTYR